MMPGHQILVVEDDDDIRDGLMDFLEDHGYEPVGAHHGRDALTKLGAATLRPCMIILDLMMPVMDGKTFRGELEKDSALAEIPIVLISAHRNSDQTAQDVSATHHLPKPLDLTALLQIIHTLCPGNEAHSAGS